MLSREDADQMLRAANQPIMVLGRLRQLAWQASHELDSPIWQAAVWERLTSSINRLTSAWGAMERIQATPLPFVYVAHLRTFLAIYLLAGACSCACTASSPCELRT